MLTEIIRYSSILSALIPLIAFIRFKSSINTNEIYIVIILIAFSFFTDIVSAILYELRITNPIISNVISICFFLFIILLYKNILSNYKNRLYFFLALYIGFVAVNSFFFQGIDKYQGYSRAFGAFLLIICSLMYYRYLLGNLPAINIMHYGLFWINTGIIYFYSFNLLLFIYSTYVFSNLPSDLGIIFWSFHNVNNIVKNILFCVGIYYTGKP
jgi:hypothetical protein